MNGIPTSARSAGAAVEAVWTLTTWLAGDPPEGFGYGYASQEAAQRNGRMFATAKGARRWRVTSPAGVVVAEWTR